MVNRAWRSSLAATFVMTSIGAVAQAQQGTTPSGVEEVVVTGVRASLENALETKREASAIVDAISAEDIGKFPDENVAESLQRITGVQITRLRGEGQNVTIRGLPTAFSQVQLNGRSLASALGTFDSQPSRSFDFTILPSEFVRSLEVYKSPTADMEEGGLAGTVIVRTARPLDLGERLLAGSVQYAWESNSDEMSPRASFLASDIFADGKFGVAVGAAYTKRETETHEQRITRYRRDTEARQRLDLNGDGSVDPRTNGPKYGAFASEFHSIFPEERERTSFVTAMQLRPNDNLELYLDGFYSKLDILNPRYTDLIRFDATTGPVVGTPLREVRPGNNDPLGDNGQPVDTLMRAEMRNVDQRADGRTEFREGDVSSFALGGKYRLSDWTFDGEVAFSRGTQTRSFVLLENQRMADVGYDLTQNGEIGGIFFGPGEEQRRLDPAQYRLLSFNGEMDVKSEDEVFDTRFDVDKELEWGWLRGVEFGGKYSDRTHYQDNKRILVSSTQLQTLFGGTLPASTVFANSLQAPFLIEVRPSNGSLFGAAGDTSGLVHQSFLVSDVPGFIKRFGWDAIRAAGDVTNEPTGIDDVQEKVSALYAKANIGNGGAFSGNIGVRVVRTEQISKGVAPDLNGITLEPQAGNVTTVPGLEPIVVDRTYTKVLPSLNLRLDARDDLTFRFSAARTLSRPTLTDLSPSVTANGVTGTVTRNNPFLDPFIADQADIAVEWYFRQGSLLAATVFYKDLISLIENSTSPLSLTITQINGDGSRVPVNVNWTVNQRTNGEGTKVRGVELSYQQSLDFLPAPFDGFGFLGNYTYMDTQGDTRLQGASKNNFNVAAYYEKGAIGVRMSYTYRGEFYSGIDGQSFDERIEQAYGTLDGSITYAFNDSFSSVLEATNILDEAQMVRYMPIDLPANYVDSGRRILLGLRARF